MCIEKLRGIYGLVERHVWHCIRTVSYPCDWGWRELRLGAAVSSRDKTFLYRHALMHLQAVYMHGYRNVSESGRTHPAGLTLNGGPEEIHGTSLAAHDFDDIQNSFWKHSLESSSMGFFSSCVYFSAYCLWNIPIPPAVRRNIVVIFMRGGRVDEAPFVWDYTMPANRNVARGRIFFWCMCKKNVAHLPNVKPGGKMKRSPCWGAPVGNSTPNRWLSVVSAVEDTPPHLFSSSPFHKSQ